jgi:hypothetical protein
VTIATRGRGDNHHSQRFLAQGFDRFELQVGAAVLADNPMRVAALLARPFASERLLDRQLGRSLKVATARRTSSPKNDAQSEPCWRLATESRLPGAIRGPRKIIGVLGLKSPIAIKGCF